MAYHQPNQLPQPVSDAIHFFHSGSIDEIVRSASQSGRHHAQPTDLYGRAQRQFWDVMSLDFTVDRSNWPGLPEEFRRLLTAVLQVFYLGDYAVTRHILTMAQYNYLPEDELLILITQAADEARHQIFLKRFMTEVVEIDGDYDQLRRRFQADTLAAVNVMFDEHLAEAIVQLVEIPSPSTWAHAVTTYHLVIEGYLATKGEKLLLSLLEDYRHLLPAFMSGLLDLCRDESRHVGYGLAALERGVLADPNIGRVICTTAARLAPAATAISMAAKRSEPSSVKIGQQLESIGITALAAGMVQALYVKD